ncbi:MAG: folylpolyglutamate synthase/dihydrofolate synthase family protein [Deltaproteobacteria bacterium]|nr:folylpolyglutamate synthase/dihydrofolate synthase family protein [Deltaproteobacteria bacterium]
MSKEIDSLLERIAQKDFRASLEPIRQACAWLGNPQDQFKSIHIAGTNGKGSTAAFLSSILQEAGLKVGCMTSPHLIEVEERIQIDREPIARKKFHALIEEVLTFLPEEEFLSYFEMITAVGFLYFAREKVDVAVVEVGLGGRLDATNILKPAVGVLTTIAKDHEKILGDTLVKIAKEKCGIIKKGMKIVSVAQVDEVQRVIQNDCREKNVELQVVDPSSITTPLGLKGEHQKINAAAAVAAAARHCEGAGSLTLFGTSSAISDGLRKTSWPGRLQILQERPTVLVDGAHNESGMQTLARYLKANWQGTKFHFFVGALREKNPELLFQPIAPLAKHFYAVSVYTDRAMTPPELKAVLDQTAVPTTALEGAIALQWKKVLSAIPADEMVVATGSLYLIGEVLQCFRKPAFDA